MTESGVRRWTSPDQVPELMVSLVRAGDIDAATLMYEPEATFSPRPDQNLKGHDAIRSGLTEIAASGTELSVEVLRSSRPATQRV